MKTLIAIFTLTLIFLAGCQKEELSPVSPTGDILAKIEVPFKGVSEGLVVITVPPTSECGATLPRSNMTGYGVATHIGSYTGESYACIVPDGQIQGTGTLINGHHTVTSANGDKLYATFIGDYVTNLTTGMVAYNLQMTFTGGTGRFTGATGEAVILASAIYGGPGQSKPLHAEVSGFIIYKNVKPLNGKMAGASDVSAYSCGPGLTGRLVELEGQLSIGFSEATLEHCTAVTSAEGGVLKNGTATIFTPDGNIFVAYEGFFTFDQPFPNQTYANIHTLTGVITGGTGKYAGAAGTFEGEGTQYLTSTPTPVELKVKGYLIK